MSAAQWRLSVSVARRVIVGRGSGGRRLVGLFLVPAFLLCVASFVVGAVALTPNQRAQSLLGSAAGAIYSVPESDSDFSDLLAKVGHRVIAHRYRIDGSQNLFTSGLEHQIILETADWTDPVLRSQWSLLSGHWPATADEVVLTKAAAKTLTVTSGHSVRFRGRTAPVDVAGIVESPTDFTREQALASPALVPTLPNPSESNDTALVGFLFTGGRSDVAHVVDAALKDGVAAATRDRLIARRARSLFRQQTTTITAPGALLVAVLSAAAFIVRVRRSGRQLAILLALGVRPATLVRASRLAAVSTAVVGGTMGVLLGAIASALMSKRLGIAAGHEVGVPAWSLGSLGTTVALVSTVALVAAWLPARAARRGIARFDGTPPRVRIAAVPSVIAAVLVAGCVVVGIEVHSGAAAIVAFVVALLSGVMLVPAALRAMTLASAKVPMLGRLATRQISRDVRRPTAAAAVGLTLMTAAVGSLVYYGSLLELGRSGDSGSTHYGVVGVPLLRVGATPSLINDLKQTAGPRARIGSLIDLLPTSAHLAEAGYENYYVADAAGNGVGTLSEVVTPYDFEGIAGRPPTAREWAAIASGQMIRFNGSAAGQFVLAADPQGTGPAVQSVSGDSNNQSISIGSASGPTAPVPPRFRLGAVQSDPIADLAHTAAGFVVGPKLVERLNLRPHTTYLHVWEEGRIDTGLGARVQRVAEAHGIAASGIIFNTGALPPLPFDWRLVLVSSTVLLWAGVGLCVLAMSEDARPFYQSLFSLGFTSRRQRVVLATQAGVIAFVAVAIGTVTGLAVGVASVHAFDVTASITFALPRIGLLAVGAVVGSAVVAVCRPGQRQIDELLA